MYVFNENEREELEALAQSLRDSAEQIDKMANIKDSRYTTVGAHAITILEGYRKVLQNRERDLYRTIKNYCERT